jgi:Phosphoinositide 3-kinase C2
MFHVCSSIYLEAELYHGGKLLCPPKRSSALRGAEGTHGRTAVALFLFILASPFCTLSFSPELSLLNSLSLLSLSMSHSLELSLLNSLSVCSLTVVVVVFFFQFFCISSSSLAVTWNQWLRFDMNICDIPEETRVCLTLYAARDGRSDTPIANVNCRLFDFKDQFLSGIVKKKMWTDGRANPIGTCVENLRTINPVELSLGFHSYPQPVAFPMV